MDEIIFTPTTDGYIGRVRLFDVYGNKLLCIDGVDYTYNSQQGEVFVSHLPKAVYQVGYEPKGSPIGYVDLEGSQPDISMEQAAEIERLNGCVPDNYTLCYEKQRVLVKLAVRVRKVKPESTVRYITVHDVEASQPYIATYNEEAHLTDLIGDLWGGRATLYYFRQDKISIFFSGHTIPKYNGYALRRLSGSYEEAMGWYETNERIFRSHFERWSELDKRTVRNVAGLVAQLEDIKVKVSRLPIKTGAKNSDARNEALKMLSKLLQELEYAKGEL